MQTPDPGPSTPESTSRPLHSTSNPHPSVPSSPAPTMVSVYSLAPRPLLSPPALILFPGLRSHLPDSAPKLNPNCLTPTFSLRQSKPVPPSSNFPAPGPSGLHPWPGLLDLQPCSCLPPLGIRAYEQLGQRAFGPAGKVVVAAVICLHNVGAMSSYLFIIKSELPLVIGTFLYMDPEGDWFLKGNLLIIIVSVLIILPLALMKHLGYLGYTSGLSLTCMLFFLVSVIYKKFQLGCAIGRNETAMESEAPVGLHNQGLNSSCEAQMFTVDSQMSYTVPIMAFAFVCHPEVLPIYTELCRPSKLRMQAVANVSIGAMFCMYGLTATFGYLTFYSNVEAEMLHMYSQKDPLILCVRLAVLLAVTLTVPVVLFPIRRALQQLLFPGKAFSWPRHVAIALILLVLVNVLVICVPTIQDIFGVIGSTSAPSLIFILPSIFYLRIVPSEVEPFLSWPKIQALCFGVLGVLFMAVSLGFMFANWATGQSRLSGH
uniref:sodium-coupled neutral amino acid transporter 5 isoform X1 n=1 Tax=Macaca mulatta TaxID=9544 RepID=UPI0010A211B9|nr:sodium-coupled neutral amino acid transporter 5 isoform X1 [Macaca mulatta]